jgi:hypothetical protein
MLKLQPSTPYTLIEPIRSFLVGAPGPKDQSHETCSWRRCRLLCSVSMAGAVDGTLGSAGCTLPLPQTLRV